MKTPIFFTVIAVGLLVALAFMLLGAGDQPQITLQTLHDQLTALQEQVNDLDRDHHRIMRDLDDIESALWDLEGDCGCDCGS